MIPFPLYAVALCYSAYFFMSFLQITFMCKVTCVCTSTYVLYCSLYVHMYGFLPPFRLERVIKASCDSKRDPVEPYSLQQTAPQSPRWKRFFLSNKNINGWLLLHTSFFPCKAYNERITPSSSHFVTLRLHRITLMNDYAWRMGMRVTLPIAGAHHPLPGVHTIPILKDQTVERIAEVWWFINTRTAWDS